ncbi:MAG TPA: DMT family transporter [Campylobacterales bacterium]|nr:DMT family transporter [Campylobacterales bacterium]
MLGASLLSALNGAIAKMLAPELAALEIVFFRNFIGVLLILITLKHTPTTIDKDNLHMLLLRGIFGFTAMFLFFYTITTLPLGDAITLNKTSPIFITILAFFILKEKLSILQISAVILGFLGVILVTKPANLDFNSSYILGVAGGFFAAAAYVTIGKIKHIYDSRVIVLAFMGMGTVAPALLFLLAPYIESDMIKEFVMPSNQAWVLIIFIGFTATLSQWFLTKGYSSPNPTLIGTISYSIIPFSIFFGVLLGDDLPTSLTIVGTVLIVLAGILAKKGVR